METYKVSVHRVAVVVGLLTSTALIAYFFVMKYMHFIHVAELRALNIFILCGGLWGTFRYLWSGHRSISYAEGIEVAGRILGVCLTIFALFIYLYFSRIDPQLLEALKASSPLAGNSLTPLMAAAITIFEGAASGIIIIFCFMQMFEHRFCA